MHVELASTDQIIVIVFDDFKRVVSTTKIVLLHAIKNTFKGRRV